MKVVFVCCFCDLHSLVSLNVTCFTAKHLKFDSHYSNYCTKDLVCC